MSLCSVYTRKVSASSDESFRGRVYMGKFVFQYRANTETGPRDVGTGGCGVCNPPNCETWAKIR